MEGAVPPAAAVKAGTCAVAGPEGLVALAPALASPAPSASAGARRRTATPGAAALRRAPRPGLALETTAAQAPAPRAVPPAPAVATCAVRAAQGPVASAALLAAAALLALGALLLLLQEPPGGRAERIAVFRELLRSTAALALPLPVDLRGPPPGELLASWAPVTLAAPALELPLRLLEVPLTAAVLGDVPDADDELPLPLAGGGGGRGAPPPEARRSLLYRGQVPRRLLNGSRGTLQVLLPGGRLLLRHQLELERWLGPGAERHVLARLCYALRPEAGPWDGALTSDCERGQRSPLYLPAAVAPQLLELVLRGRMDAYVHASEVTQGCSSCFGRPYGDQGPRGPAAACAAQPRATDLAAPLRTLLEPTPSAGRCFGRPRRQRQALGLALLGLALLCFGLAARGRGRAAPALGASAALLFAAASGVHVGFVGAWRRTLLVLPAGAQWAAMLLPCCAGAGGAAAALALAQRPRAA